VITLIMFSAQAGSDPQQIRARARISAWQNSENYISPAPVCQQTSGQTKCRITWNLESSTYTLSV